MMATCCSKYHSRKITKDGQTFDSLKEYRRFCELSLLEKAGAITDLQRQVKYMLIPAQYEEIKGRGTKCKLVERECSYIADFVYQEEGNTVVEDVKGYKKGGAYSIFSIKRKLMLLLYGIRIKEV